MKALLLRIGSWIAVALAAASVSAAETTVLHGAGATFPAPLYRQWAAAYESAAGVVIRYDAVGSGEGIARIRRGEIDFGTTDAPLSIDDLREQGLAQFPVVVGGVVPVVNIPGIAPGTLKLSGELIARIYLGQVRKWNAPPITELNPDIALPNANITVVHRGDASGTSFLWTSYLSAVSPEWKTAVGAGTRVVWPLGVDGTGNEGVASYVRRTRFSLGYVEYAYAKAHRLADAALDNADGQTIRANLATFRAAAAAVDWSSLAAALDAPIGRHDGASWPITGASFVLVRTDAASSARSRASIAFFEWALKNGRASAEALDYVPLPAVALERAAAALQPTITDRYEPR